MIIDFHTHVLPPRVKEDRSRYVERDNVFAQIYSGDKVKIATTEDILGPDYLKGPVSRGAMTHQEFLAMVTPKDVQVSRAAPSRPASPGSSGWPAPGSSALSFFGGPHDPPDRGPYDHRLRCPAFHQRCGERDDEKNCGPVEHVSRRASAGGRS